MEYEQAACAFLKEVVQGNKLMKRIKDAAEGNLRNNINDDNVNNINIQILSHLIKYSILDRSREM